MRRVSLTQTLRLSVFALGLASMAVVATAPNTFAATQTWTGTDCATDCSFSNTLNWVGGTVPVNGDSVVLVPTGPTVVNDINGLSLVGLTMASGTQLRMDAGLNVEGVIDVGAGGPVFIQVNGADLTLTGDVNVVGSADVTFNVGGMGSGSIVLGGNQLTLAVADSSNLVQLNAPITGGGTVVYGGDSRIYVGANNTYLGDTQVTNEADVQSTSSTPFGTSSINVGLSGQIIFRSQATFTLSNTLTIAGTSSSDPNDIINVTPLIFTTDPADSFTLSGIVLNGNSRFSNSNDTSVNLAGITANGFCIMYAGSNFTNGPVGCSTEGLETGSGAVADAAAPNTAVRMATSNPVIVAALGLITVATLALVAQKIAFKK
jgi:hypothetical protein